MSIEATRRRHSPGAVSLPAASHGIHPSGRHRGAAWFCSRRGTRRFGRGEWVSSGRTATGAGAPSRGVAGVSSLSISSILVNLVNAGRMRGSLGTFIRARHYPYAAGPRRQIQPTLGPGLWSVGDPKRPLVRGRPQARSGAGIATGRPAVCQFVDFSLVSSAGNRSRRRNVSRGRPIDPATAPQGFRGPWRSFLQAESGSRDGADRGVSRALSQLVAGPEAAELQRRHQSADADPRHFGAGRGSAAGRVHSPSQGPSSRHFRAAYFPRFGPCTPALVGAVSLLPLLLVPPPKAPHLSHPWTPARGPSPQYTGLDVDFSVRRVAESRPSLWRSPLSASLVMSMSSSSPGAKLSHC